MSQFKPTELQKRIAAQIGGYAIVGDSKFLQLPAGDWMDRDLLD